MKLRERLEHFLKYVDESTYWKEDNDGPNHVIVHAYLEKFKPNGQLPSIMQAEGSDEMCGSDCCPNDGACEHCQNPIRKRADGAAVGNSAAGTVAAGMSDLLKECYRRGMDCGCGVECKLTNEDVRKSSEGLKL